MRLLVQSLDTGRFLVPDAIGGGADWCSSLREAGGGVLDDPEAALQVAQEFAELGERVQVVDLDRLGTADDYALPDGNHGDNDS